MKPRYLKEKLAPARQIRVHYLCERMAQATLYETDWETMLTLDCTMQELAKIIYEKPKKRRKK